MAQILLWLKTALCWLLSGLSLLLPLGRWLPQGDATQELFNRYRIVYTATVPVKGEITYTVGSCERTEAFYLEAAEAPNEFKCFIDGFLDGRLARGSKISLSFSATTDELQVESTTLEWAVSPKDTHPQLEDAFCRAGVDLRWGGALDSFVWKAAPAGYGNLFNRCDAGRLVQQSYYGTSDPPYVMGSFMDTPWPYNPVQGGDVQENCSKLVDYELREDSIYIKCLPLEWGKDNVPSLSYMENTYTLRDGILTVDNRFVDFSGYTHPSRHQEMPAFYTVSALGTFSFYDGGAPWTNAPLTQRGDLPFWGGNPDCYFPLAPGNTETWCAWTAGTAPGAFGVGLFTPGIEILLAGRYGTNVSKDANDASTSYVAPLRTLRLESFVPLEYSYYITAGTLEHIRGVWTDMQAE